MLHTSQCTRQISKEDAREARLQQMKLTAARMQAELKEGSTMLQYNARRCFVHNQRDGQLAKSIYETGRASKECYGNSC